VPTPGQLGWTHRVRVYLRERTFLRIGNRDREESDAGTREPGHGAISASGKWCAMKRMQQLIRRMREERGITGLETAIVLIAFVVVAAVFAFVVLSTGLFSSERAKETVYAGLAKTRGTMELTGGVLATSDGTALTRVTFDVTLAAGGDSVNLDPATTSNRTVITYIDAGFTLNSVVYTTTTITGNADKLLEQGELLEVSIDLTQNPSMAIGANKTFTLEIKPPSGSFMVIQRTTPASVAATIIDLN
jgi:flagellin FlaB